MAEDGLLGYWRTLVMIVGIVIGIFIIDITLNRTIKNCPSWVSILCFWLIYILTRPLGACLGDFLTAHRTP